MNFNNLNKKVTTNWIIRRIFGLIFFASALVLAIVLFPKDIMELYISVIILIGLVVTWQIIYVIIFPFIQYKKYLYLIKDDEIVIMKGVIFQSSFVVPVVQIQDVGYSQGPVQLAMNLTTIQISTAGSNQVIDGISKEEAIKIVDDLKEKIKKFVNNKANGEK